MQEKSLADIEAFLRIVRRKKRKSSCAIYGISGRTFGLSKADTTGPDKVWDPKLEQRTLKTLYQHYSNVPVRGSVAGENARIM